MGFFHSDYLDRVRNTFQVFLNKFQYQVEDVWYDAEVVENEIEGNKLVYNIRIPATPEKAHIITGIRILDMADQECAYQQLRIERSGIQTLLVVFEFYIQEV